MNFASEYVLSKQKHTKSEKDEHFFQPDTNVISATFDHLVDTQNTHAGEALYCSKCTAVLSKHSKISDIENDVKKLWTCEFCNFGNVIFVESDEIPNQEEVTYLIESDHKASATNTNSESNYIVYCIDVSGSMSVTTPVQANFSLPTDQRREESFRMFAGNDFSSQSRSRVRHITRLEAKLFLFKLIYFHLN